MRRLRLALPLAALTLLAASPPPVAPVPGAEYVAMGSSFAAGPGIGRRAAGSHRRCAQSEANYPHLLARRLGLALADMSCSGATTFDVLGGGTQNLPPQIDAVGPATRLVTVTVGGNDIGYMHNLWAWSCPGAPDATPVAIRAAVCAPTPPSVVARAFAGLAGRLQQIAAQVHARAPRARLVFINYLTVLPDRGRCAAAPMPAAAYAQARYWAARLLAATHAVAASSGSLLVSAAALTRGHDVCAPDPWVSPFRFTARPDGFDVVPYHPNAVSMAAVADETARTLAEAEVADRGSKAAARSR